MTYLGEDDLRGYRMVINRCLLIVIVCMGIISLAMGLSPLTPVSQQPGSSLAAIP